MINFRIILITIFCLSTFYSISRPIDTSIFRSNAKAYIINALGPEFHDACTLKSIEMEGWQMGSTVKRLKKQGHGDCYFMFYWLYMKVNDSYEEFSIILNDSGKVISKNSMPKVWSTSFTGERKSIDLIRTKKSSWNRYFQEDNSNPHKSKLSYNSKWNTFVWSHYVNSRNDKLFDGLLSDYRLKKKYYQGFRRFEIDAIKGNILSSKKLNWYQEVYFMNCFGSLKKQYISSHKRQLKRGK